jgi:predicted transcriptional regulator
MLPRQEILDKSMDLLRAIDHPIRVTILTLIAAKGPIKVNDIIQHLNLNQALVSQQLKILREVKLVRFTKVKTEVHYQLNIERLAIVEKALKKCFK